MAASFQEHSSGKLGSTSVDAVTDWLIASGVAPDRIGRSQSLGWLQFDATAEEAERLLDNEHYEYEHYKYKHRLTGQSHVACSEYSLPKHVQVHIDFNTPTMHFDAGIAVSDAHALGEK